MGSNSEKILDISMGIHIPPRFYPTMLTNLVTDYMVQYKLPSLVAGSHIQYPTSAAALGVLVRAPYRYPWDPVITRGDGRVAAYGLNPIVTQVRTGTESGKEGGGTSNPAASGASSELVSASSEHPRSEEGENMLLPAQDPMSHGAAAACPPPPSLGEPQQSQDGEEIGETPRRDTGFNQYGQSGNWQTGKRRTDIQ